MPNNVASQSSLFQHANHIAYVVGHEISDHSPSNVSRSPSSLTSRLELTDYHNTICPFSSIFSRFSHSQLWPSILSHPLNDLPRPSMHGKLNKLHLPLHHIAESGHAHFYQASTLSSQQTTLCTSPASSFRWTCWDNANHGHHPKSIPRLLTISALCDSCRIEVHLLASHLWCSSPPNSLPIELIITPSLRMKLNNGHFIDFVCPVCSSKIAYGDARKVVSSECSKVKNVVITMSISDKPPKFDHLRLCASLSLCASVVVLGV